MRSKEPRTEVPTRCRSVRDPTRRGGWELAESSRTRPRPGRPLHARRPLRHPRPLATWHAGRVRNGIRHNREKVTRIDFSGNNDNENNAYAVVIT